MAAMRAVIIHPAASLGWDDESLWTLWGAVDLWGFDSGGWVWPL